jgi:hypothetical protein
MSSWQGRKGSLEIKMYTFNLLPASTTTELFWLTFNQSRSLEGMESQNFLHFLTGNCFVMEINDTFEKLTTQTSHSKLPEYVCIPDVKRSVIT